MTMTAMQLNRYQTGKGRRRIPGFAIHICLVLLLLVVYTVSFVTPVFAIDDPDTYPQISSVYVYEFIDGSIGVLVDYYLDYAVLPTETVTESYLVVITNTDGLTQLKSVAPYTYVNNGYGRGVAWIPFTAAEAVSAVPPMDISEAANYRIWLTGNPTLAWGDDPPKKISEIDVWAETGDIHVLLSQRILNVASSLQQAWGLEMFYPTADGYKLTATGESYFEGVIPSCRSLAPGAFADTTSEPEYMPISYSTEFGATATSGTATVAGSPQTLTEGTDTIDTGATVGTIIIDLADWTVGTIADGPAPGGGTLDGGSPIDLYPGANTITVTAGGTFTTDLEVVDSASIYDSTADGTGFDLTDLATSFGMSRWMLSGLVWLFISIIVCAAVFFGARRSAIMGSGEGSVKVVMVVLAIMMVGGVLLGMLHPLVVSFTLIAYGAFIGYMLFFRSESLHKGFMFMVWMFVIVSISGNIAASGQSGITATRLVNNITDDNIASIEVASTVGFSDHGLVRIEDEIISYPHKDDTHFLRTTFNPIIRGSKGTEAIAHPANATVKTETSWMLNASIDYKIARITDSAGALSFIAMPIRLMDLIMTFFVLPLDFLGSDLAIIGYLWIIIAIGMVVGFVIQLAGGRRV